MYLVIFPLWAGELTLDLHPGLYPCCLATLISPLTLLQSKKTELWVIIMG